MEIKVLPRQTPAPVLVLEERASTCTTCPAASPWVCVLPPPPRPRSLQAEGGSPEPAFPHHGAAGPPAHLHSCVPPPRVPPKLGLSCVTQNPASENLDSSMEQNAMYPTRAAGVPGCGHGCPATHPNSPKERIPPRC